VSPGAGRAELRLSRGFPRSPGCDVTPQRSAFDSDTMCTVSDIVRQKMREALGRAGCIERDFWGGITIWAGKREAPVRAEPHPTYFERPQPYLLGNLARISFTASLAKAWSLSPDCLRSTLVFAQPRQISTFFLGSMKSIIRVPLDACPG
jgi:hypothetical protein